MLTPSPSISPFQAKFIFRKLYPHGVPGDDYQAQLPGLGGGDTAATLVKTNAIVSVLRLMREGEEVKGGEADGAAAAAEAEGEDGAEKPDKPRLRFELPFIAYFRKEDYAGLDLSMVKRIPELDLEYFHLQVGAACPHAHLNSTHSSHSSHTCLHTHSLSL